MRPTTHITRLVLLFSLVLSVSGVIWSQADDPCSTPVVLPINNGCVYANYTNQNATATAGVPNPGCGNYTGGDVWFTAVVPASGWLIFDMQTQPSGVTDGAMALYTGTCGALTLVTCDAAGSANNNMPSISQTGLTPGTTVFLRVWSEGSTPKGPFSLCARRGVPCNQQTTNATCQSFDIFCTGVSTDYCNTTGVPSLGSGGIYGCLGSTPNPSFYAFSAATGGTMNLQISQQTAAGGLLDVDYVIWGPFANQASICSGLSAANILSCSYSINAVENATLNTVAGQWYMVLITNFSNQPGFINFTQTNSGQPGAGASNCNGLTVNTSACASGLYNLTGTVIAPSASTLTGTLTISTNCGTTPTVINLPAASPINYAINGLTGNGNLCQVTAVFSDPAAQPIAPTQFTAPNCCVSATANASCAQADPFCTGSNINVCNTTDAGSLGGGGIYGCLVSTPNPAFYAFNVQQAGPLEITLNQTSTAGTPIDVDFVVWGPFTDQASICGNLTAANIVDCSFSFEATEIVNIDNPPAGSWYMLLVTNYSNTSGTVNIFQSNASTPGAGVTNCNVLTATPSACSNGQYSVSGFLYSQSPPSSGSVTITNSCNGQSLTFNAPFSTNLAYSFNNLCGNGQPCQITAVYSTGATPPTPATFTAPSCGTITATPSACTGNTYSVSGNVTVACPPASGTLTVTTSCGGSVVINTFPASGIIPYTIPNIPSGTQPCTVSAVFSASGAPIVPTTTYTPPFCCTPTSITVSVAPASANFCVGGAPVVLTGNSNAASATNNFSNPTDIPLNAISTVTNINTNPAEPLYVKSLIAVTGACGTNITSSTIISVNFNLLHTFDSDVVIWLQAPNGTFVRLVSNAGGGGDNFTNTTISSAGVNVIGSVGFNAAPFSGVYASNGGSFASFIGAPVNGNWTLWIGDDAGGDTGTLLDWTISFTHPPIYAWTPAAGLSSTNTLNTTASPTSTTTYTLTATNGCGCSGSATATLTVSTPPTVTANAVTFNSVCAGPIAAESATPAITLTLTPATATANWALYSGTTATGTPIQTGTGNPNYAFTNSTCTNQSYVYRVIPTLNGCNGAPLDISITVKPKPLSTFTVSPNPVCIGQTATLTYTSPTCPTSSFNWESTASPSPPTGYVPNLATPGLNPSATNASVVTVTPSVAGTYTIRVQSTAQAGCIGPMSPAIALAVSPLMTVSSTTAATACQNQPLSTPIQFNTTGATGIGTVNGLPAGITPVFAGNANSGTITLSGTPTAAGTFNYSIPLTGGCGPVNATGTITVNSSPTAIVVSPTTNPANLCVGSGTPLNFSGTPGATINYTLNSVNGSVGITPSGNLQIYPTSLTLGATWPANTTLIFTSVSTGSGASACSTTLNIPVIIRPQPAITSFTVPTTACTGTTATLNIVATPNTVVTFAYNGVATQVNVGATGNASWTTPVLSANATVNYTSIAYAAAPLCTAAPFTSNNTITVTNSVTPSFGPIGPFCFGATASALPTISNNGVSGTWSPASVNTNLVGVTNYTFTPSGTCAASTTAAVTISDILDYANLQFPANATICQTGSFDAYGQVYNDGLITTIPAGQAAGITVQIGYSTANTDPLGWSNWTNATFNAQVGNNDEYKGTLSGLAPGTYYYAFRYQINGCAWQYGGYSSSGGGFWNGTTNVSGILTVNAVPQAGVDASLTICATGSPVNLFASLGGTASTGGSWSGPSALTNGNLGTFDPLNNAIGAYTYTVAANGCPNDFAIVNVALSLSPTAALVYPSPICQNEINVVSPTLSGTTGGVFSSVPVGLTLNTATGALTASTSAVGNYTVTYSISSSNGCAAFSVATQVSVAAAPATPTLAPQPACTSTSTYTSSGATWYEFFVNGTSQGAASPTATLNAGSGFAAGTQICVRSYSPPPIMDGLLTDQAWGAEIAGTTGGALSSFGPNRIDGLKLLNRNGILYGAVAGTEEDGVAENLNNRIALFIDCRAGGFNNLAAWTNRNGANSNTGGLINLNNGIVFDAGFEADYILTMNRYNGQTFYDLYDMTANTNNYLGSGPSAQFGFQQNAFEGDLTKGFEFMIPLTALGSPIGVMKIFGMLINDPPPNTATTISNQFITPANIGEGSYGNGAVFFNNAAPNPVLYQVTNDCYNEACVTVQPSVTPNFVIPTPLCYGAVSPILSNTSPNNISGIWLPPLVNTSIEGTTNYTFTPNPGNCAQSQSIGINIVPQILTTLIFHN